MTAEEEMHYLNSSKANDTNNKNPSEIPSKSTKIHHLRYRLVKTGFLFISWISLGLFSEIIGPALPAIRVLTDTNYEEISRALSSRSAGLLVGSLFGGLLADQFVRRRNLLIFIFLTLAGLTIATIPYCQSLTILAFNLFISGFSHGAFTTSGNPSLCSLWLEKSTGPYNFMHSGYGLGAAVAPLLIGAFDTKRTVNSSQNNTILSNDTHDKASAAYIRTPFVIVAIYCIFIALIFFLYCFLTNPIDENEVPFCRGNRETADITSQSKLNAKKVYMSLISILKNISQKIQNVEKRTILVMVLCFISYFALVGNERVFGKFQFSYAIEGPLKMSKSHGYLINCLYWVSFCLARIFVAVLAVKVPAKVLLIVEIVGALVSSIVFCIWNTSELIFFIFSTSFGFFKSPLFPTMLGVLSLYVNVSGILVVIVNFGSAFGAMSCQYMAGYLIQNYGQYTFPLTVTGTAAFLLAVFVMVVVFTRKWKKIRHDM